MQHLTNSTRVELVFLILFSLSLSKLSISNNKIVLFPLNALTNSVLLINRIYFLVIKQINI
jgi:hypothetical protein